MSQKIDDLDKAARGEKPERVPVVLWNKGPINAEYGGVTVDQYYSSLEVALRAQIAFQEEYPSAILIPGLLPDLGPVVEASAFGCSVIQPQGQSPFAMPCMSIKDASGLRPPDPNKDGLMPKMLEGWRYLWETVPKKYVDEYGYLDGCASTFGPMETAAQVLGYDQFFIALYDHPKLVHQLLDVITDGMIAYVNAQAKINGPIKRVTVTDHVAGQISAEHFREYGLPYLQRLFQAFPDAITIYHNEADIKRVLPFLPELDFTVYHMGLEVGGDYAEGVALARRTLGNRCLMGNVHSQEHLLWGTRELVYQESLRQLDAGAKDGAMWLSVRGGFAPGTPRANIHAMIQAAEDWSG